MPREMKPIGAGRLDALKGMMGGETEPQGPAPAMGGHEEVDIPGMIDALENDALPAASPEKRAHLEKAIEALKACVASGEKPGEPMPEPEPEAPAA